ncbi:GNAT family N-acetyltransferase [Paenactinomyces guangxiensis]|uniref:GNAT family N-acetyltransferase n=1 Tax=Paenactinomyces guangxiensis TaxID=1490290 RepID=A0A7W1WRM5_9BACL|nr:GNAT family N-acetyltransferase [Paenactinomyces guangxiensis]MBA4494684.1 GNAT family N-acetyltransferase [Paenactinomyces guangxiensis]MBH8591768.1 GNAT family N-acetyltransferase [Paenactinomyces guangxiensis]
MAEIEIRMLNSDEFEEAVQLSNQTFRSSDQSSMELAFPQVFSLSLRQSYGAFKNGKMVSFIGLVPAIIHIGAASLNVFSIGSVCTEPASRGKGYASKILNHILAHADRAGASLLLVSGYGPLYTRANCFRFGTVMRYSVEAESAEAIVKNHSDSDCEIRELTAADWFDISELARKRIIRYEQSVWDLAALMRSQAMASCMKMHHKVLLAGANEGLKAFLVLGLPNDPQQNSDAMAVEWGGDGDSIGQLLAYAAQKYQVSRIEVPVPWHETSLAKVLAPAKKTRDQNLGTVHIVDFERFIRQIRPFLHEKSDSVTQRLQLKASGKKNVEIELDGHHAILDSRSFVSLVFDQIRAVLTMSKLAAVFKSKKFDDCNLCFI